VPNLALTEIEKLLSRGSESLAPKPVAMPEFLQAYALGPELFQMLRRKMGSTPSKRRCTFFLSPLILEPDLKDGTQLRCGEMNTGISPKACSFLPRTSCRISSACLRSKVAFIASTQRQGQTTFMAESVEEWAGVILSNYRTETGWPFVHEWQGKNGPLPLGKRLMPKTPFFLGGEYKIENLWPGNPLEGMRFKADLAMQTRNVPEGAQVKLNIAPKRGRSRRER
jgi:hypothetical protein